jgi:hypothetical protein
MITWLLAHFRKSPENRGKGIGESRRDHEVLGMGSFGEYKLYGKST